MSVIRKCPACDRSLIEAKSLAGEPILLEDAGPKTDPRKGVFVLRDGFAIDTTIPKAAEDWFVAHLPRCEARTR
jgi:hypothetical protein